MISIFLLFEANKFTKLRMDGKLSDSSLNKIRNAGMTRSKETIRSGMAKGTENLKQKYKVGERQSWKADISGPYFDGDSRHIVMPKGSALPFRILNAIKNKQWVSKDKFNNDKEYLRRHEAYEGSESFKRVHRMANNDSPAKTKLNAMLAGSLSTRFTNKGKTIGGHVNVNVLAKEDKDTRRASISDDNEAKFLRDVRQKTGEKQFIDHLGKKGIKKSVKESERHYAKTDHDKFFNDQDKVEKRNALASVGRVGAAITGGILGGAPGALVGDAIGGIGQHYIRKHSFKKFMGPHINTQEISNKEK